MALLQALGVDFIGRSVRRVDGRRGRRLGPNDWLMVWHRGAKEPRMHLITHNLIRWTMGQAAREHGVELEPISFKGTLDGLREFSQAISQARSGRQRRGLWVLLLKTLAAELVPERPGRREPRAVKRKRNKYPRLNQPRHQFRDPPKRHERRRRAKMRRSLM
ncbi:MAG: hypothetical protein FJ388_15590 [Verrucomicrobia bacterium]|nr:hypothetical protein [Verrucomicrobiota bacterium]